MILLVDKWGNAGLVAALFPMGIGYRIRRQHDRSTMEYYRAGSVGRKLFILYYIPFLGSVVIYCAINRINLANLPVFSFLLLLFFPILVVMVLNDLKACLPEKRYKAD
jgi:hypothetical protein